MFSRSWGIFKRHDAVIEGSLGELEVLPEETITHILSFVGESELMSCFLVSRDFYRLANDNAQWHQRCVLREMDTGTSLNLRSPRFKLPTGALEDGGNQDWKMIFREITAGIIWSKDMTGAWFPDCGGYWKRYHVPEKVFAKVLKSHRKSTPDTESPEGECLVLNRSLWYFSVRARKVTLPCRCMMRNDTNLICAQVLLPGSYRAIWRMSFGNNADLTFSIRTYDGPQEETQVSEASWHISSEDGTINSKTLVQVDIGSFTLEKKGLVVFGIDHNSSSTYEGHRVDCVQVVCTRDKHAPYGLIHQQSNKK